MSEVKKKIKHILQAGISILKTKKMVPIIEITDSEKILNGKVALITGGTGGIGVAIAKNFIQSGCKVILAGRNEKKLKEYCKQLGEESKYITLNLLEISSFENKINEAIKIFGKIDILVNSAGIHIARSDMDFINVTEKEYDDILNLNLKGTYFFTQVVAKYMIKNKIKGHILIISSQSALEPAWSPYRLSKWGAKGLTEGIAKKLIEYGIVVNSIAPGPTATAMQSYEEGDSIYTSQNPIERYTMPNEVAEYAKILVTNLGNTVIGDTIYMSGGRGIIEKR